MLLEDRLAAAKDILKTKSAGLFVLQETLTTADQHRARLLGQQEVLEKLADAFGPRCVIRHTPYNEHTAPNALL